MQRSLYLETGVNELFEDVFMSGAYSEFFQGEVSFFLSHLKGCFFPQFFYFKQQKRL